MSIITLDGRLKDNQLEKKIALILKRQYDPYYKKLAILIIALQVFISYYYWNSPLWSTISDSMIALTFARGLSLIAGIILLCNTLFINNVYYHNLSIFLVTTLINIHIAVAFSTQMPNGQPFYNSDYVIGFTIFAIVFTNNLTYGDIRLNGLSSLLIVLGTSYALYNSCTGGSMTFIGGATDYNDCKSGSFDSIKSNIVIVHLICAWVISLLANIAQSRQVRLIYVSSSLPLNQHEQSKIRKNNRRITPEEHKQLLATFDQIARF